jgi:hypothetical protein
VHLLSLYFVLIDLNSSSSSSQCLQRTYGLWKQRMHACMIGLHAGDEVMLASLILGLTRCLCWPAVRRVHYYICVKLYVRMHAVSQ